MTVHQLIHHLKKFPIDMDVYIFTSKHEPVELADVRDHKTRDRLIVLLSAPEGWRTPVPPPC